MKPPPHCSHCRVEVRTIVTAVRRLIAYLPKCDECALPATRAWKRGAQRFCDTHGATDKVPEYPRAQPLRDLLAAIATINVPEE